MLDHLRQIAVFAKTVEHGSFRRAATALNLSPSVVSHHISQLEERLGVALLYRSTRRLSLTREGEDLFASAQAMIDAAETGIAAVSSHSEQPSGELRITLPAILSHSGIVDHIAAFSQTFPKIKLSLDFSDVRRELIRDGIDIAIRMGWLQDSTLKARKLCAMDRCTVASAAYLKDRPTPKVPADIEDWDWIGLTPVAAKPATLTKTDGTQARILPKPQISVNDAHALYRLVKAGAGVGIIPKFMVTGDIANGSVEPLCPDWEPAPVGIYAVWPPNVPRGSLQSRFVTFMAERTKDGVVGTTD